MPKGLNKASYVLEFSADTNQAKRELASLQKTLSRLISDTAAKENFPLTEEIIEATKAAASLKAALQAATDVNTGKLDLVKFTSDLEKSGESISDYGHKLSALGPSGTAAFKQVAQAITNAEIPLKRTNSLVDKMWTTLKNTARWQFSSAALHAMVGAIEGAYGYAQDLDKSLTNIAIVTGNSVDNMKKFADQANKAAQSLSTSTLAYTDAALIYYQQGLNDEEVAQRTETTLKMSNVTGESAEEVSSYMTAIWNNFRKGGESLELFADKITALGAATASSSAEIAGGLQQFAAIANTVGLSYDYAATALATVVAKTRQSESTVGNAFRTIFARLSSLQQGEETEDGVDLTKYTKALQDIGITLFDQNNQYRAMDDILDDIGAKWQVLSKNQQIALAQTVGGVRQYATIMALFDDWGQFQENLTVTQGAKGTLQEQADIYAESWEAAQKRVKAAWQALYQDLIDDKFFITILNGIADILKSLDSFVDKIGGLKSVLVGLSSVLLGVFGQRMADSISDFAEQTYLGSNSYRKKAIATRLEAWDAVEADTVSTGSGEFEAGARADSIRATKELQQELIQDSKFLTEEEVKQFQSMIDGLGALRDRHAEESKLLDDLRKQKEVLEEQADARTKENEALAEKKKTLLENIELEKQASANKKREEAQAARDQADEYAKQAEEIRANLNNDESYEKYAKKKNGKNFDAQAFQEEKVALQELADKAIKVKQELADVQAIARGDKDLLHQYATGEKTTNLVGPSGKANGKGLSQSAAKEYEGYDSNVARVALAEKEATIKKEIANIEAEIEKKVEAISTNQNISKDIAQDIVNNETRKIEQQQQAAALEEQSAQQKELAKQLDQEALDIETKTVEISKEGEQIDQQIVDNIKERTALQQEAKELAGQELEKKLAIEASEERLKKEQQKIADLMRIREERETSFIRQITTAATIMTQIATTVTLVSSAIETLNDETIKDEEKITKIFSTILMLAPLVVDAITKTKELLALSNFTTAGAIVAGLSLIFLGLKAIIDLSEKNHWFETAEEKAKRLREEAEETHKAFKELYDGLTNHQEALKALEDLKEGTLEWNDAVKELNDNVLDLIDKYPELAKYVTSENGVLKISQEGMQAYLDQKYTEDTGKTIDAIQSQVGSNKEKMDQLKWDAGVKMAYTSSGGGYHNLSRKEIETAMRAFSEDPSSYLSADALKKKFEEYGEDISSYDEKTFETLIANREEIQKLVNQESIFADKLDAEKRQVIGQGITSNIGDDIENNLKGTENEIFQSNIKNVLEEEMLANLEAIGEWGLEEYQNALYEAEKRYAENPEQYLQKAKTQALSSISDKLIANNNITDEAGKENIRNNLTSFYDSLDEEDKKIFLTLDIDDETSTAQIRESIEKARQAIRDDIEPIRSSLDKDVDEEEWETLTKYVHDNADEINKNAEAEERLSEDLKNSKQAASQVAEAIIRFDDAIQDVTDHYEDWNKVLSEGSTQEKAKAAQELADAYGDLMDIDGSALSATFLESTENLDLMKDAIEGDEEAYDKLVEKMGQDIIAHCDIDKTAFDAALADLNAELDAMNFKNLEIGADLNTASALQAMQDLVNAAHMTKEQAEAYLASMGIDAEIEQETVKSEDKKIVSGFTPHIQPVPAGDDYFTTTLDENGNAKQVPLKTVLPEVTYTENPTELSEPKTETGFTLKVKSATKSSGGNFKFKQSTHGGGTQNPTKTGKGGGGGGKKTTQKEHTKPVQNQDRYHDIKERIDDLNKSLQRLNKTESRVYGKAKLKYMDQEIEKLEKQIDLTDEYIKEIKKYAAQDQANLRGIGMGAEFDENGMLTNYEQVLANITNSYNAAIGAYNGAIDVFNGSAQEEADNENLENAKKQLDAAKEVYDENQKILKQYEDTYNLLQEQVDKRIDQVWELFDMRLKRITFEVEFEIDWNERDLKYLDWLLNNIGDTADKGVDKIANLAKQMNEYADTIDWAKKGIQGIFGLHGINFDFDNADPVALTDQLTDAMHRLNFESQLTEDEANALLEYCETLMSAIDGIKERWEQAHETVNDTWDKWNERIERDTKQLEHQERILQGIKDIADLTGRNILGTTTEQIANMGQSMIRNLQDQTAAQKAIWEARQASADEAKRYMENAPTEEAREQWRKTYEQMQDDADSAQENYYSSVANTLKKVQDVFSETMENIKKDYNDAMGDLSLITEQFNRKTEISHLYLDDYEKYHELNKSASELKKSLENTNNTMIKSKLNDLLDEINQKLNSGVQMSEAQTEIIARRVALLQAEAELMDAQNAKSAVRMTRDNEGNFSYTYTADQDLIDGAEQNYADKFYELLKFERDYQEQIQGDMLQKQQDFIDQLSEINETYKDDEETRVAAIQELLDDYMAYEDFFVGEMQMDFDEMARLRNDDWAHMELLTHNKLAEQDDFIDSFTRTITGGLHDAYHTAEEYGSHWLDEMQRTHTEADKAAYTYQQNVHKTYEDAGLDITTYGNTSVQKMQEIAGQSDVTRDKVTEMSQEMTVDMDQVMNVAWNLDSVWSTVMNDMRNQISQTVSALYTLLQRLQEVQRQAQATIAAAQAAAMAQQYAGLGNSLGNGNGTTAGNGNNNNNNNKKNSVDPPGQDSYKLEYAPEQRGGMPSSDYWKWIKNLGFDPNQREYGTGKIYRWVPVSGATGMYTGAWGPEGKLAILHEKELVLNKEDTANILNVVDSVRSMVNNFGHNALDNFAKAITNSGQFALAGTGTLDQNVHIEANFPNVQSHTEIELALNNLVNSASQYVNRK